MVSGSVAAILDPHRPKFIFRFAGSNSEPTKQLFEQSPCLTCRWRLISIPAAHYRSDPPVSVSSESLQMQPWMAGPIREQVSLPGPWGSQGSWVAPQQSIPGPGPSGGGPSRSPRRRRRAQARCRRSTRGPPRAAGSRRRRRQCPAAPASRATPARAQPDLLSQRCTEVTDDDDDGSCSRTNA